MRLLPFELMGENINKTDPCSLILLKVLHQSALCSIFGKSIIFVLFCVNIHFMCISVPFYKGVFLLKVVLNQDFFKGVYN